MSDKRQQINPLKAERCWLSVELIDVAGDSQIMQFLADTGSPTPVIIGTADMMLFMHRGASDRSSNFGNLAGSWLRVAIPEVGVDCLVLGYASDHVVSLVTDSSEDFDGLIGLPLLRLAEYGGDADSFWIRRRRAKRGSSRRV
jgi:hypothetical protein